MDTGNVLNKEELIKLLQAMPSGYIKPTFPPSPQTPVYKKMGVLIDIAEMVDASFKPSKPNNNYSTSKSFICSECKRILPTAHLLDLHITEQHDFYFAASVERGNRPMYSCYLEECVLKFTTVKERKDHCITEHKFPSNYRFDQGKGKKKCKSFTSKPSTTFSAISMDANEPAQTCHTIKAFTFGHHNQRAFNTRLAKSNGKGLEDVRDIKEALDDIMD
ncbi:protein lethal(2)k10201 [Drosophila tropicalis]|uniref:protein lethal(2)k10201 n=1 Tax=Drosophila tropicalis TaxID=46794 RepID=UPI0035AB9FF1